MKKIAIFIMTLVLSILLMTSTNVLAIIPPLDECGVGSNCDGGGSNQLHHEIEVTLYSDGSFDSITSSFDSFVPFIAGTHSFLHFKNTGNVMEELGIYKLYPGEEVTVGIYGNRDDHIGIWYNLEAYLYNLHIAYTNSKRVETTISESDIDAIDDYMDNSNTWTRDFNCSSFASEIWNLITDDNLDAYNYTIGYDTPLKLSISISQLPGFQIGIDFIPQSNISDEVGYYGYNVYDSPVMVYKLP